MYAFVERCRPPCHFQDISLDYCQCYLPLDIFWLENLFQRCTTNRGLIRAVFVSSDAWLKARLQKMIQDYFHKIVRQFALFMRLTRFMTSMAIKYLKIFGYKYENCPRKSRKDGKHVLANSGRWDDLRKRAFWVWAYQRKPSLLVSIKLPGRKNRKPFSLTCVFLLA